MWPSTPSVDTLTRPRVAVAIVSAIAAASVGYYAYQSRHASGPLELPPGGELHRSNAVRRHGRRPRRTDTVSSSSSEAAGDENADSHAVPPPPPAPSGDAETVVEVADDMWNEASGYLPPQRAGHNIVNLLFRVSEDNARRNGCVHRGCQCNACGMVPIRGVRYRCANCADFDLCETCEAQGVHTKTHIFYKIRVPAPPFGPRQMQPVWYTGDPDTCRRNLPKQLIARLSKDTGFERPELEAFWEQWTFMANTELRDDPDELNIAMDRKTFERCLVPTGGSRHAAPNLIHDRMFSFYDSNNDDLIGFSEFLHGLSYRKRKDKLLKVFEGYDLDGDGYVNRRDFLRMFRAYYVLYKQMHKDILDGLEDQLLASTEAQQLVTSRQPLSSLFGREGRVPAADSSMRFEGKTYNRDGSIELDDRYHGAIVENRGDTANREDILTSLFAYDTDQRPRRRFIARRDTDTNWRTVRRLSGTETDRAYWVTLLDPPVTLEDLPDVIAGNTDLHSVSDDEADEPGDGGDDERDEGDGRDSESATGVPVTDSELRARSLAAARRKAPKLEKRRRDMARKQLHERWKRRQFYLDEEEGGQAPDDWENDEDVLATINKAADEAKSKDEPVPSTRSRSSSKVRFAEDRDDYDTRSNPSTSSRSIPERWGGMDVPDAEKDAGKEILYQVTQQAFNELLDTIFKPAEDLAIEAAETKKRREQYRHEIDAIEDGPDGGGEPRRDSGAHLGRATEKAVADKSLEELLSETGYTVVTDEPRNAVDLDFSLNLSEYTIPSESSVADETEPEEYRDPTMPQFRPNSDTTPTSSGASKTTGVSDEDVLADDESDHESYTSMESEITTDKLRRWKMINDAEAKAAQRGGWGRLSYKEFEEIYKNQEDLGNRLDYLGSWIDFCIP
ncbi:EF hand domain-containing protein [Purpureocillium lavendulum]|uniref:EF hand domain-containing protein n=1 Tax=Purpureocillium lavendulum TaxID=1247861 RepID=A0AB34FWE9_9HYPO|nr:EF hand domain-containing protein [Purpureocillium lavendulum]